MILISIREHQIRYCPQTSDNKRFTLRCNFSCKPTVLKFVKVQLNSGKIMPYLLKIYKPSFLYYCPKKISLIPKKSDLFCRKNIQLYAVLVINQNFMINIFGGKKSTFFKNKVCNIHTHTHTHPHLAKVLIFYFCVGLLVLFNKQNKVPLTMVARLTHMWGHHIIFCNSVQSRGGQAGTYPTQALQATVLMRY